MGGSSALVRSGAWLFRHRGWLPLPFLVLLVALARPTPASLVLGGFVAAGAELLRFHALRCIGPASRTRDARVGPLALAGPYRWSRNPLYVANIVLYFSFALASATPVALLLPALGCLHYRAIVAWEERRLLVTHADEYRAFCARVPRWFGLRRLPPQAGQAPLPLRAALRAERSTLLALGAVFGALVARMLLAAWL